MNPAVGSEEFERLARKAFRQLPKKFRRNIENVVIAIEDYPSPEVTRSMRCSKHSLLGLYQGVPLPHRGTSYGMYPVMPDTITLYEKNILAECSTPEEVERRVLEVLFHEIGHYFGMTERQIRTAMKDFL